MIPLSLLPHTCTIIRPTPTGETDDLGNAICDWAELSTGVPCRFEDKGTREVAGRYVATVENPRLYMLPTQDITDQDRVTGISVKAGTFEVIGVRDPGGVGHHLEIELEKVE